MLQLFLITTAILSTSHAVERNSMTLNNNSTLLSEGIQSQIDISQALGQHSGSGVFTIRLLVIPDYASYMKWLHKSNNDNKLAEENMKFYLAHVVDGVNNKYKNLQVLNKGFTVLITDFYLIKQKDQIPFIEKSKISSKMIDGTKAIIAMKKWLIGKIGEFRSRYKFDAILVFTGYDIKGLRGVAYTGAICSNTAAGIIKDFGIYETIDTTTHELGHLLGSLHDGEKNYCNPRDYYIMSPERPKKVHTNFDKFSTCSTSSIQTRLADLQKHKCLQPSATRSSEIMTFLQKKPGMRFNPDYQCQLLYGEKSFYCGGGGSMQRDICQEMLCWDTVNPRCEATRSQKASDGTPCGDGMWCVKGNCIQDPPAPRHTFGNCLYGDYRGGIVAANIGRTSCDSVRQREPWLCYDKIIQDYCCKTCAKLKNQSNPECQYGDKTRDCSTDVCHDSNWKSKCCKTCLQKKSKECPDGDLASWCSAERKSRCYTNKETCCETCRKHFNAKAVGCEYGDKESWCPSYISSNPNECTNPNTPCCETCQKVSKRGR